MNKQQQTSPFVIVDYTLIIPTFQDSHRKAGFKHLKMKFKKRKIILPMFFFYRSKSSDNKLSTYNIH